MAIPALSALGHIGGAGEIAAMVAVVTDGERSDDLRVSAAQALAGVFGRAGTADQAALGGLIEICRSDAPTGVRVATATALGRLNLSSEVRAEIVRAVRAGGQ